MEQFDLIVIGGGAAGFYGAIQAAEMDGRLRILILEKSPKLLSKVRVSGGGRCNVTHHCFDPLRLSHHYPRGEKKLRTVFKHYDAAMTVAWFASRGVQLKTEDDGRMFPVTDNSQTIIDCFLSETRRLGIGIITSEGVVSLVRKEKNFELKAQSGATYYATNVLVATGGNAKPEAYEWLASLGHTIRPPLPSLFTFNDSGKKFTDLMGISVPRAEVRIAATKLRHHGPLLITHWGLSGPAVIRLSAWAAEYLHQQQYVFTALVSWIGPVDEDSLRNTLLSQKTTRPKQKIAVNPLFELPQRLWLRLCELSDIDSEKIWSEIQMKQLNRLLENLSRCPFNIRGKTTFKEEFVTCGGVDLACVDLQTMESTMVSGLFFAGEVLNIDGETGGFNFQAAWSTAFLAAKAISEKNV